MPIKIKSTSGSVTLDAQNVSGDQTLTVPSLSGGKTLLTTDGSGASLTSLPPPSAASVTEAMVHADAVNSFKSGRRRLNINGNFDLWQRGTSFTNVANVYTADRWFLAGGGAMDCTRQTGTSSDLHTYYSRVQRPSGQTHTNTNLGYAFELVDIVPLRGKTITASCKLRKGANYSATSDLISVVFGANNDSADQNKSQNYIDGITSTSKTLTSSWQTFSFTTTVHAQAVAMVFRASATTTGTAGANDYFDIAEVQVEVSSTVTDFEHRSYGEELALCQRYYEIGCGEVKGGTDGTGNQYATIFFRTTKRTTPTITYTTLYSSINSIDVNGFFIKRTNGETLINGMKADAEL